MGTYIEKTEELPLVMTSLAPPLFDCVLVDYSTALVPDARDAEVLELMTICANKLKEQLTPQVDPILDAVMAPTLGMITADFTEFPEHRIYFFRMLRAIDMWCFQSIMNLREEKREMFMNSVFWAIKHPMRDISETGLNRRSSFALPERWLKLA
jgi:exportin-1